LAIYRGAGGAGDAVGDASSEVLLALQAKDAAIAAEVAAETAQAAAQTSATNASNSASSASTSATNASNSASSASTSASNASTSATNASNSASAASTSATNASNSASAASTSATNASNSATAASTSASNASTSASNAATAQAAAEAARDSALSAYDNFDDRYLGAKSTDPTLDNDGNALLTGALYYNTTSNVMKVYTGSSWVAAYVSATGVLLIANNLSDLNSVSTARTNLGLAIGTDVQAYDADLATIAGLTPTNNYAIIGNGTSWTSSALPSGLPSQTSNAGKFLKTDGSAASWQFLPTVLPILNRSGASISVSVGNGVLPILNRSGSTVNVAIN